MAFQLKDLFGNRADKNKESLKPMGTRIVFYGSLSDGILRDIFYIDENLQRSKELRKELTQVGVGTKLLDGIIRLGEVTRTESIKLLERASSLDDQGERLKQDVKKLTEKLNL